MNVVYINKWSYMQDNAPAHVSKFTIVLRDKEDVALLEWPPHSPDLNIIKNIWGWMKRKIDIIQTKTIEDLKACLIEVWDSIDQMQRYNLIASSPRRLQTLIQLEGKQTIGNI